MKPSVLLTTEGTYPFILGGVSTWCDILVNGLPGVDWSVLALTAGGLHRTSQFEFPSNVSIAGHVDLWSETVHPWNPLRRGRDDLLDLPGVLVRGLLEWNGDAAELTEALTWCRRHPSRIRVVFRSRAGWAAFLAGLESVLDERVAGVRPAPDVDVLQAAEIYQSLYWIARTAAEPTEGARPDASLVSAAGWAAIPAVVQKAMHGTPIVLTEHGVYVREAYLQAMRESSTWAARWAGTRLARGLARLAYTSADVVAPVAEANSAWERALGVSPDAIQIIYNGVLVPPRVTPPPVAAKRVVSVGRIDPLKDLKTMLRAASAVLAEIPEAEFLHYGPVAEGAARYFESCLALHRDLELGSRFRFMGGTDDPYAALRGANVAFFSSISEGFPIIVLEAMACGRPVVATAVGGVPEAVAGCGFTAPPGSHESLAAGIVTLLKDDALAIMLGHRAHARVARKFGKAACLEGYHRLLSEVTGMAIDAPALPPEDRSSHAVALQPNERDDGSLESGPAPDGSRHTPDLDELVRRSRERAAQ